MVVTSAKVSPAFVQFTLRGKSFVAAVLEYAPVDGAPGGPSGIIAEAQGLPASPDGIQYEMPWTFETDVGDFQDALKVRIVLSNGRSAETDPAMPVVVGNLPPVIDEGSVEFPPGELVGPVPMQFVVTDTDDLLDVRIEVNVGEGGGFPEASWTLARPVLSERIPDPTFDDVFASSTGSLVRFTWDVEQQFPSLDTGVLVRLSVNDQVFEDGTSEPLEQDVYVTPTPLRVDNNAPPGVALGDAEYVLSPDQRLGIAVPYTVSDAEGDTVEAFFQWTLEDEPFPELPTDVDELEAILADPVLRRTYRVATPYSRAIGGRVRPTGADDTVELPELGSTAAHLLQHARLPAGDPTRAFEGLDLELLRPTPVPTPLASTWAANPLDGPVAALSTPDGTTARVLDRAGGLSWRVRDIALDTGDVVDELAAGAGEPDTMVLERRGAALLVAVHEGTLVRIVRLELASRSTRVIFEQPAAPGDHVRGLASLGTNAVVATLGDALLRIDYSAAFPSEVRTVRGGLETPWGVLVDPLGTNRVLLAERDGGGTGRLLSIGLDRNDVRVVPVGTPGLPRPEALALEREGSRVLVLTDEDPTDARRELRAVELGRTESVTVIGAGPLPGTAGLATGPDGLRLMALAGRDDLAVAGGVAQRRAIVGYDAATRVVTVAPAFAPPLRAPLRWRMSQPRALDLQPDVPRRGTFAWDSRDLPGGQGRARLRMSVRDADVTRVEHGVEKEILSSLAGPVMAIPVDGPRFVEVADLDGDGTRDLVTTESGTDTIQLFFQTSPRSFTRGPALGSSAVTDGVSDPEPADLDGDGDLDLVSANAISNTLTVFFQTAPGEFDPVPLVLGGPGSTTQTLSVEAADLDGDGDLDLACANLGFFTDPETEMLSVFFQTSPGTFDPDPLRLGGPTVEDNIGKWVKAADLDGDGDVDLAAGNEALLAVFFQSAPGTFDPVPLVFPGRADEAGVADLDDDGDLDLLSADGGGVKVYFQTDPGTYDPVPLYLDDPAGNIRSQAAADLDGDGALDLVSTNTGTGALSVFFQRAPGVFGDRPLSLGDPVLTDRPVDVAVSDLDGDGRLDLVSAIDTGTLVVFFQQGRGGFEPSPASVGSSATLSGPQSVEAADLDGDGDLDLASANLGSQDLTVFLQSRPGEFDPAPLSLGDALRAPVSLEAADLDGDGDLELVSANKDADELAVFFQTAPGTFADPPLLLSVVDPFDVEAGDVDGDGALDLVCASLLRDEIAVFFQSAPGAFSSPPLTLGDGETTDAPTDVEVADLDGDGRLDVLSANVNGDSLAVFLQIGPGEFTPLSLATESARAVEAADLDRDGDLDLVAANRDRGTLTLFFQTSPGAFGSTPLVLELPGATSRPFEVAVADLDRDQDADLVAADPGSGNHAVFLQTRPGEFELQPVLLGDFVSTPGPLDVELADVDGDGDSDVVSAASGGSALAIFFNAHRP